MHVHRAGVPRGGAGAAQIPRADWKERRTPNIACDIEIDRPSRRGCPAITYFTMPECSINKLISHPTH